MENFHWGSPTLKRILLPFLMIPTTLEASGWGVRRVLRASTPRVSMPVDCSERLSIVNVRRSFSVGANVLTSIHVY